MRKRYWAKRWFIPKLTMFVYVSLYEITWIGVQRRFTLDGTMINVFGIGIFIGDEFWWRIRNGSKGTARSGKRNR